MRELEAEARMACEQDSSYIRSMGVVCGCVCLLGKFKREEALLGQRGFE